MAGNWLFQKLGFRVALNPNVDEEFQNEDVDIVRALAREPAQNTSDAPLDEDNPVDLVFTHIVLDGSDSDIERLWVGLKPHLTACGYAHDVDFSTPSFLLVEDYNTTGILGDPVENEKGSDWHGFFWKLAKSGKGGNKGGRRGLGRSVFAIASQLRCFFAITRRSDDPERELMMGLSLMEDHELNNGEHYGAITQYALESEAWAQPIDDQDFIQRLKVKLNLQRGDQPGTSVIVPYPTEEVTGAISELQKEVIRNYLVPISRSQIRFNVCGIEISKATLPNLMPILFSKTQAYVDDFLEFIEESYSDKIESFSVPLPVGKPPPRFLREHFNDAELESLRSAYDSGQLVRLNVDITAQMKSSAAETGMGSFCLKKTKDGKKGEDYYIRARMPVLGESKFKGSPVFGLFFTDDDFLVELLGDSENGNHNNWNSKHPDLKKKYDDYFNAVLLCKNGLISMLGILIDTGSDEDTKTFADYFPIKSDSSSTGHADGGDGSNDHLHPPAFIEDEESDEDDEDDDSETDNEIDIDQLTPLPFQVTRLKADGGFVVKASKNAKSSDFPLRLDIAAAYDLEGRNPFNQYRPSSFNFEDPKRITINSKDLTISNAKGNEVSIRASTLDFEFKVLGFDTNRDLLVKTSVSQ